MFMLLPLGLILIVYIGAAVLPAAMLLRYVYRKDKIEKESPRLLRSLLVQGVLAALLSILGESIGMRILSLTRISPYSSTYYIVMSFLVIAVVEEGAKFFFLFRRTFHEREFDYTFDAIVYSVFVSLGFAAFENIQYIFGYGLSVALPRAFLSIPGHMSFAVVFGCFYGKAKRAFIHGNEAEYKSSLLKGYLSAVCLHGFYDSCAMIGTGMSTLFFILFIVWMYMTMFGIVRKASAHDRPLWD